MSQLSALCLLIFIEQLCLWAACSDAEPIYICLIRIQKAMKSWRSLKLFAKISFMAIIQIL